MSHIDYRTDIPKHFVRKNGWLPACKIQKRAIRKRSKKIPLRYFTFCAAEAIDVFMLEREQILQRSQQTGRLESVFFCEKDLEAFGKIADLIGSPAQGFQGEFENIVLFEEDNDTIGRSLDDLSTARSDYSDDVWKKLKYKDAHYRFRQIFPFDVINLDVCGVMFPPRQGVNTPLLKSLIKILEWQSDAHFKENDQPCKQFTLFLTSHVDPRQTDANALEQLTNRLIANVDTNPDFRVAFINRYGHPEVCRLLGDHFAELFCLSLLKVLLHKTLFDLRWKMTQGPTYLYNRPDVWEPDKKYQMMHSVSTFKRIPEERLDEPNPAHYNQVATQIVRDGLIWVDGLVKDAQIIEELRQDLESIVNFRNGRG